MEEEDQTTEKPANPSSAGKKGQSSSSSRKNIFNRTYRNYYQVTSIFLTILIYSEYTDIQLFI